MTKKALVLVCVLLVMLGLSSCKMVGRYNIDWMLGKNSNQIQARYGEFYGHPTNTSEDGLYTNCICTYPLRINGHQLFGDPLPDEFVYIEFDEYGIAYRVYEHTDFAG